MLTFEKFTGINNVLPPHRLKASDLVEATDVNIGLDSEISRRDGYTRINEACHKNVWQARGFMLATCEGDLVRSDGETVEVLTPSLGSARVWYCNLPDGRTTFSNGLINGITDGTPAGTTSWGPPIPEGIGAATDVAGELFAGEYQRAFTYVRLADGLEGPPVYAPPVTVASGGLLLTGLPTLAGHALNVYLSSHNGAELFLAGQTLGPAFSFTGGSHLLVQPCRTDMLAPMPVGTLTAFWRGRVLVAKGSVLYASLPHQWELCDLRRDFKQFSAPITLVQPVDGGVFVGTEHELAFLGGTSWDALVYARRIEGRTVLGSGVSVPGDLLARGDGTSSGDSMVCIADRALVAGYSDGGTERLTKNRYTVHEDTTEVAATFRKLGEVPQYIALPL